MIVRFAENSPFLTMNISSFACPSLKITWPLINFTVLKDVINLLSIVFDHSLKNGSSCKKYRVLVIARASYFAMHRR